jgi:hypothetical protein
LSDDEEDRLRWSQSGRASPAREELAHVNTKGAAKGFRVDPDVGVAFSVCLREAGVVGSPLRAASLGGGGGRASPLFLRQVA